MTESRPKPGYSDEEFERILKAQEGGLVIIEKHFRPLWQEFAALGYKRPEVASALIMLAYETLRKNMTQEQAEGAFISLFDFGQLLIEHNIKQTGAGPH
jgi:hypothetical protein